MEQNKIPPAGRKINRRSLVKNGAALFGAGLLGSAAGGVNGSVDGHSGNLFNVRDFGATGKRDDNATKAIQSAVDACTISGGGVVYVPPGDYTVGSIQLKDHVNLNLDAGATFFLSQDRNDFSRGARTMIFAENATTISVTGKGIMDGMAQYEFTEMNDTDVEISKEIEIARKAGEDMRRYYRTGMQTFMFVLNGCTNVLLRDISVIHSPLWNIRLNDCDRVFVQGIYIFSDLEKGVNADGIDICSSKNVTISDSVIVTGDDSIVLKTPLQRGKTTAGTTENILVTNCVLTSSSTPLMIGTETYADIRHVIFSNCTIRDSNKGFGINVQDGATVSDIIISNLTLDTRRRHWNWWGSCELCKFVLKKREETSKLGKIKDVVIDTVIAHPRGTSIIEGHPEQPLENIWISDIQIFMEAEDAKDKRATDFMQIKNVRDLKIRNMLVRWSEDQPEPKWQSALVLENVTSFEILDFSGRQGLKDSRYPAIALENVSDGVIGESRATAGCGTFIRVSGEKSSDIDLRNNRLKKAKTGVGFESDSLKKAVEME